MFLRKINNHNGQALLIVVLVMVIALTVTLSLVSRSIVNLKTSLDQTNSQKALAAAEAGVEQAIKNNVSYGQSGAAQISGAQYAAKIEPVVDDGGFLVNGGNILTKNEGAYVWFSSYSTTNPWSDPWPTSSASDNADVYIYWGDRTGADKNAALEVILIYGPDRNNAQTKRYVFDPSATRATSNNFNGTVSSSGYTVLGNFFQYRATVNVSQGLLMRVIPVYNSTYLAVKKVSSSSPALPEQGRTVISSGCTPNCTDPGITKRKIVVYEGYPIMPVELFPYSIFAP